MSETLEFVRTRKTPPEIQEDGLLIQALNNPVAVTRELNNQSLYHFMEYFWPVYSSQPFKTNWHIVKLCAELEKLAEDVAARKPRDYDLIINVPPGTSKPVWEEMDVLMANGVYKKLKEIKIGDSVINKFGKSSIVQEVHIQGDLPCLKIKTFGGRNIVTAYDHPLLTADGWENAIDIKEGQMLALMHSSKIQGTTERTLDDFRLAGYFIGDGSASSGNCSVCGVDMEYIDDLIGCIDRLGFGYYRFIDKNGVTVINLKRKENSKRVKVGTYKGLGRGFRKTDGPRQWLRDVGISGKTSKTKKIPDFVWLGTDDQIKIFLAAYFQCDGCVTYRDAGKRNISVSTCTVSKELAVGMQRLFLRIGISMKIRTRIAKNGFAYNRDLKNYEYYTVDTTEQDSAVRFLEEIPLIGYKLEKLKTFAPRKRTFTQEYWPDEVLNVEKVGVLPCRCLSVDSGQSFIVEGVVVHNTVLTGIMFPAWCWTKWYWMRFITASYSKDLALETAEYSRDLIRSMEFQRIYPDIDIKADKDTKSNFRIVKKAPGLSASHMPKIISGGSRYSTSVGSTLTGFHADIIIIDDPLNPKQAASDVELKIATSWMDETVPSRKTDKAVTPTILIMQRLNREDPTGHMLEKQKANIRHICLPGECRNYLKQVQPPEWVQFYQDDLLDPVRMPWKVLQDMEADLGQYGYAGQFGQNPTPPGGGMFKVDHFQLATRFPNQSVDHTVRYWDKAGTKNGGDYTVGLRMCRLANGFYVVEDVKRGQWGTNQREDIIKQTAEADGVSVEVWIETEPGSSGKESSENTIRNLAGFVVRAEHPTGDKATRADPYSVQVNNGNVILMAGDWVKEYLSELRFFPFSRHKDQVDSSSGAFSHLVSKRIARRIT